MTPPDRTVAVGLLPGSGTVVVRPTVVIVARGPVEPTLLAAVEAAAAAPAAEREPALAAALAGEEGVAAAGVVAGGVVAGGVVVGAATGAAVAVDRVRSRTVHAGPVTAAVGGISSVGGAGVAPAGGISSVVRLGLLPTAGPVLEVPAIEAVEEGVRSGGGVWIVVDPPVGVPGAPLEAVTSACGALTHPMSLRCPVCGELLSPPRTVVRTAPVPVVRLVLDDGRSVPLLGSVAIGREPNEHPTVRAGEIGALELPDAQRTLSRVHALLVVDGWDISVQDEGSANGTAILPPGSSEWTVLLPKTPVGLLPGTDLRLGRRTMSLQ